MKYEATKEEKKKVFIRVIPQFTIQHNRISLIAEESVTPFKKGDLVVQASRMEVARMLKPHRCEICITKTKMKQMKYVAHLVYHE